MNGFYVLRHRNVGPVKTFLTKRELNEALGVLYGGIRDDSAGTQPFAIERFELRVAASVAESPVAGARNDSPND